jgi:hypothetical protein
MAKQNTYDLLEPDVFDILSATWVFACNDENSIITYEGLRYRLALRPSFDIKGLVKKRTDLFRLRIPPGQLTAWKEEMRQRRRLPVWIQAMPRDAQEAAIEAISVDDGFRSQFRSEAVAPRSDLEILRWGLAHVESLRKAHYEANTAIAKSWQMWLVVIIGLVNIAATVAVTYWKESRSSPTTTLDVRRTTTTAVER